jgi:hypothetical protein
VGLHTIKKKQNKKNKKKVVWDSLPMQTCKSSQ